jgi:putative ATPase
MIPLAERMRPHNLNEFIGQEHLTGPNGPVLKALKHKKVFSMIFWGPPGVGKTTLAQIIAQHLDRPFFSLSAISSGVKDVRDTIEKAEKQRFFDRPSPLLFIDEIHRFSKSQQDALLGAVEKGIITLIGATTENPSFEVIPALLSRCQVYVLKPLHAENLKKMLSMAIKMDSKIKIKQIELQENEALLLYSSGDGRKLYNALEIVVESFDEDEKITITNDVVHKILQEKIALYDKSGEQHYDIISAFIKSIRGSDPNAAIYYLARMLHAGEPIEFIARRLIILAAEDVGLANPNALLLTTQCFEAIRMIGMPEARIILSQTTIYLATSPKSNSAYLAINNALDFVKERGFDPVPLHLRNAPTQLMKDMGYGKAYLYPHDQPGSFAQQEYLPEILSGTTFYKPGNNPTEEKIRTFLKDRWNEKYNL